MTTETQHNEVQTSTLWLSVASGPLLWAAYHSIVYALASQACQKGFWLNPITGSISALALILLGITLVVVLLMALSGYRAYNSWQRLRDTREEHDGALGSPDQTRSGFMAFSGLVLNILFGAAVLVTYLPNLFFDPCS